MISPRVLHCLRPHFALAFNIIIHPLFAPCSQAFAFPCPSQMINQSSHFRFWTGHSTKAKGRLLLGCVALQQIATITDSVLHLPLLLQCLVLC